MEKIALFSKSVEPADIYFLKELIDLLNRFNCRPVIYHPLWHQIKDSVALPEHYGIFSSYYELKKSADILFSIGGDGTMLDTISLVRDSGIPVLGINLGRLGFLSGVQKNEISSAVQYVVDGRFTLDQRTLIQLESPEELFNDFPFALNEISITRTGLPELIVIHVQINNLFLNTYWSDGLLIATPTGSTAYSLSCFGPILTPDSQNFVITPIASHNLTVRPIVIPDDSVIQIKTDGRKQQYQIGLDSRYSLVNRETILTIKKAAFKINLVQLPGKDFFSTIREKLLWGKDQRN